jgi:glycosyltransferase involved in cell wall biosynthesis
VRRQTFKAFEWILVNDGGAREPVDEVARQARDDGITVRALHNVQSRGRPGALNDGLKEARGRHIAVHDDDDTWEPRFLETTSRHLDELPEGSTVRGVVTRTMVVEETINTDNDSISTKRSYPYDREIQFITLFQMAKLSNVFPPISFVYDNSVLNTVGFYREDLSVLEDWEFNLRFLRKYDIDILDSYLSNYHFRRSPLANDYSNSVITYTQEHALYHSQLRNELLRKDLDNNTIDIGFLINICHELEDIKKRTAYECLINPIYRKLPKSISGMLNKLLKR